MNKDKEDNSFDRFVSSLKGALASAGDGLKSIFVFGRTHAHYLSSGVHGFFGDRLALSMESMAITMSFRFDGKDVSVKELDLSARLKGKGRHVAVFVHGLLCDEVIWISPAGPGSGFGAMLAKDTGKTVLYIRYNSGRGIPENGKDLSLLLEELFREYGGAIKTITLMGHSMGGLVVRSAALYGALNNRKWVSRLKEVFFLGTPNSGALLEKLVHFTVKVLKTIPNPPTNITGSVFDLRSQGIKDLKEGRISRDDWNFPRPGKTRGKSISPGGLLRGVRYHNIIGTIQDDENTLVSQYIGDGLVGSRHAEGSLDRDESFSVKRKVFTGADHFSLITRMDVYLYIRGELS